LGFAIGRPRGRARFVGLFTAVLLIIAAVPVLAQSSSDPQTVSVISGAEAEGLPTAADVAQGIDEAETRQTEEKAQLETPAAEAEREESQLAYADVTAAEAAQLLRAEFSEQLELIDQDPRAP
jgi:hypothetical protein